MSEFMDKTAIVTGSAQGIGYAIAKLLAMRGANVVITDINASGAASAAANIEGKCSHIAGDISDHDFHKSLIEFTVSQYGKVDILVNNAGIAGQVDLLDITEEQFTKVLDVNLKGTTFLSQLVLRHMIKNNYGRIVNIASLAGERGGMYAGVHYSTSKAGVIVLTKCLALRGGPHNVTANAVAPGLIMTALADKLKFSTEEVALKRLGQPEEVAEVAAFLASDRASYVSGCTVDVNGGQFMR